MCYCVTPMGGNVNRATTGNPYITDNWQSPQPFRDLIAAVLYEAFDSALDGDRDSEQWLASPAAADYCTILDIDHGAYLRRFKAQRAAHQAGTLKRRLKVSGLISVARRQAA